MRCQICATSLEVLRYSKDIAGAVEPFALYLLAAADRGAVSGSGA